MVACLGRRYGVTRKSKLLYVRDRLPQDLYDMCLDTSVGRPVQMHCTTCDNSYPLIEVPVYPWEGGFVEYCPLCHGKGLRWGTVYPYQYHAGSVSRAAARACEHGGIYRKYKCHTCQHCGHPEPYHIDGGPCQRNPKFSHADRLATGQRGYDKTRRCLCPGFVPHEWNSKKKDPDSPLQRIGWHCGMFLSGGVVADDVTVCVHCETPGCKVDRTYGSQQFRLRKAMQVRKRKRLGVKWVEEWGPVEVK
jgi:hypothetical protein